MNRWRIPVIFAIAAIALAAMIIPALKPAKIGGGPHNPPCSLNLKLIQAAKEMYAADFQITNEVILTKEQILPFGLGDKWRECPEGGLYLIGALHESPRCSYHTNLQIIKN